MRPSLSLPDLLTCNALAYPYRLAVTDNVRAFDYRTLHVVAGHLADRLREVGIGRGDRVAVLGPRDARLFVLIYGILRSGGAAVAIDPDWSMSDVHRRLNAVDTCYALTTDPAIRAPGPYCTEAIDVDALAAADLPNLPVAVSSLATDLAYLSFTSGSGGEPKAVAVTHANAMHYAESLRCRLGFTDADALCIAHVTTLAADLGHTSWLLALATAGSVHIIPDHQTRDCEAFWVSIRSAGVSVLKTTPSHLAALLEGRPAAALGLHTVILGGETLSRSFAAKLLDKGVTQRVVNHYGPTETTVGATCFIASAPNDLPSDETTVPIGTAIGEVGLRLLDCAGRPVPAGAEGELFIAGQGVTGGYFGRPSETARRFIRHDGKRMYQTGDVCRRRPDGNFVFVGRSDRQVKIRGFRVNPAEVERVIEELPSIRQAAVIVRDIPTGRQLLAAVRLAIGHGEEETIDALRSHLHDRLPGYSVPRPIFALPDFPIGSNGKLDLERLSEIMQGIVETQAQQKGPRRVVASDGIETTLVHAIAELWAEALDLPFIDVHADVFDLGGDSILVMQTIAFLRRAGHCANFEDLYNNPTPMLLASVAQSMCRGAQPPALKAASGRARRLAPAQRWLFRQPVDELRHWNQSVVLQCRVAVDAAALSKAVEGVLARHQVLRQPVGPDGPGDPRPADGLHVVTFSSIGPSKESIAQVINGVCTELHRSLNPGAGLLLRVHLFAGVVGVEDRLAVIAHHLAIDGLSWRILLDDLACSYRAALAGRQADLPPTADFYEWAAALPPSPIIAEASASSLPVDDVADCAEPAALTWALDESATALLVKRHGRAQRLEALLLTAFAEATLSWSGQVCFEVEVETHGRAYLGDSGKYMDTIGWFTAVKWVTVDRSEKTDRGDRTDAGAVAARIREVERRIQHAPELPMDVAGSRPEAGFNFLGTFRVPDEPSLNWSLAPEQAGTARCPSGDPLYRLRLTARIIDGKLVTDLVCGWPGLSHDSADSIMASFARDVAAAAGATAPSHARSMVSTSGQVLHPGTGMCLGGCRVVSEPTRVLLTGATGYLGSHLVTAFVEGGAQVTCLVRGECDADAVRRLDINRAGVDVIAGDINQDGLGLSPTGLARAREAHVVIHAAADVRLVASPAELEQTNNTAVRRLLTWIDAETRGARFHHVSTLAVAGTINGPARRFSEADLWIGQSFRTPYERVKFDAERTVRSWAALGRQCYIHRSGHIAAHSRTGAFQRNIGDNRIYQTLRGYVLAGTAPTRPSTTFEFSYVDTVAAGIAAIATYPHAAPGVYHVETTHQVSHDELVEWMIRYGYAIILTDDNTFVAAMTRAEQAHPTEARLASAWAQLEDRNIVIDSSYTTSVLNRLGVHFTAPTAQWWSSALSWAINVDFLPLPIAQLV
ncbi:MAG: amino acid adenylation domain-containing protein [Pseudonocardiaceae bacterium]